MGWVAALYATPRVKVNGTLSDYFQIRNGTRQGCPLSPLLFAMILEPFLCKVRGNIEIQGVRVRSVEYKVSAYADDLLFYLSSPQTSLPALMAELSKFGDLSNFKIHFEKSVLLPSHVSLGMKTILQNSYPFIWNKNSLAYLGIHITADPELLYDLNYGSLMKGVMGDLQKWRGRLLTWFGRVSAIKMSVLPKIIYLFHKVFLKPYVRPS